MILRLLTCVNISGSIEIVFKVIFLDGLSDSVELFELSKTLLSVSPISTFSSSDTRWLMAREFTLLCPVTAII